MNSLIVAALVMRFGLGVAVCLVVLVVGSVVLLAAHATRGYAR